MTQATPKLTATALAALTAAIALLALFGGSPVAPQAHADVDPAGCTDEISYDPSIPTWESVLGFQLGAGGTGTSSRATSAQLYQYYDAVVAATAGNPRVAMQSFELGTTELGRRFPMYVISTPANIANLNGGRNDAAYWRGVRTGEISPEAAAAEIDKRPGLGWITGTPHGTETAGGEAIARIMYELAARTDCANLQRLKNLDTFLIGTRNPDGRDNSVRTSSWAFDHNRDVGTRTQSESRLAFVSGNEYPGLFYVDAHQQPSGYFFPPNEDPVLHEISDASIDLINSTFGAAFQNKFNDQSLGYRTYNAYDLFAPVYGDSVPSLMWGGAGMTFEKGTNELYSKQVYDHYLVMDETLNVASREKRRILAQWVPQWEEATEQGANCELETNELVSPLHDTILQQPNVEVCGYYYLPGNHPGDAAQLLRELRQVDVDVYRLTQPTPVGGAHEIGPGGTSSTTLPAGTLWIPMAQTQKHWIQAVLGEDPFVPFAYFYDVAQWSYSHMWGMSGGNGLLRQPMPGGTPMTLIGDPGNEPGFGGSVSGLDKPVLAFNADSSKALALAVDLLRRGVTVYRGKTAFNAEGQHFDTGAALVDASTLGGADIAALADERDTPITGIDNYPVPRFDLDGPPKIGVYTVANGGEPPNVLAASPGQCSNTGFCFPLFGLTQKLRFPPTTSTDPTAPVVVPVSQNDLHSSATFLSDNNFTAFYNNNAGITMAGAITEVGLTDIQDFVNNGGRYISSGTGGISVARSAGLTNTNTSPTAAGSPFAGPCPDGGSNLQTDGANFPAEIDTANPVGWGFDDGGSLFRHSSSNAVIDPATLTAVGTNPAPTKAFGYPDPLVSYGYTCHATGPGQLPGRPAVVDAPFGAGHAVMFAWDPFWRSWQPQSERIFLNAALLPTGAEIPADAPAALSDDPANSPLAGSQLPAAKDRPAAKTHDAGKDLIVRVKRKKARALRKAVRKSRLPAKARANTRWVKKRKTLTLIVRNARKADHELSPVWVHNLEQQIAKRRINPLVSLLAG